MYDFGDKQVSFFSGVNVVEKQLESRRQLLRDEEDLAGVLAPHMQGISLLPVMNDRNATLREEWYFHHDVHTRSKGKPLPKCEGVRTECWKYIHYKDTDPVQEELFDLKADAKEQNNLAGNSEYSAMLSKLRDRCAELRESLK